VHITHDPLVLYRLGSYIDKKKIVFIGALPSAVIRKLSTFQTEEAAGLIDDEAEEDEEYNSDDEEDDDDDELEPGEVSKSEGADEVDESDDDEEAPVEKPVSKKSEKANSEKSEENRGIPKVKVGKIPLGTPKNQIVFVTNLPNGKVTGLLFHFSSIFKLSIFVPHRVSPQGLGRIVRQVRTTFRFAAFH